MRMRVLALGIWGLAVLQVKVNTRQLDLAINKVRSNMELRRPLLEKIGAALQQYTQQTIMMQGRNRAWAPLAPSTQISTGRTKALVTLIPFIRYRVNNRSGVTVYFSKRPKGWSLDAHERGFTSRAVPTNVFMKAKRLGGFSGRAASRVPGRKVWPTLAEIERTTRPLTRDWISDIVRKSWR